MFLLISICFCAINIQFCIFIFLKPKKGILLPKLFQDYNRTSMLFRAVITSRQLAFLAGYFSEISRQLKFENKSNVGGFVR